MRVVHRVETCASTNDLAALLPAGEAVIATSQSAGRGQYGRVWDAPAHSALLMSVACGVRPLSAPILTAWATVAVAEAVAMLTGLQARIKWPNDLLIAGRKISGILVEQRQQLVIGIGLNLTRSRGEFEAVGLPNAGSLGSESGVDVSVDAAANAVLDALNAWEPTPERIVALERAWSGRLGWLGHEVEGERFDGMPFRGRVTTLRFDGLGLDGQPTIALEVVRQVGLVA